MRILYCGEFDPCGVGARQRKFLRALGIDFRVAVRDVYWAENLEHTDAWLHHPDGCKTDELTTFAKECDLIVFAPCIAQWWSSDTGAPVHLDEDELPIGPGFSLSGIKGPRRLALFHGSNHLAEHAEEYAAHYRAKGYTVASTTLDYLLRMGGEYVPSIVDLADASPAPLRQEGEELRLIHCPSDSVACQTEEVGKALLAAGVTMHLGRRMDHAEVLAAKATFHAGYDHVRGSFSINSIENAALGLVNLVGVRESAREWLRCAWGMRLPWPELLTAEDVVREAVRLRDSVGLTADMQAMGRDWYLRHWNPAVTAERVLDVYRRACA